MDLRRKQRPCLVDSHEPLVRWATDGNFLSRSANHSEIPLRRGGGRWWKRVAQIQICHVTFVNPDDLIQLNLEYYRHLPSLHPTLCHDPGRAEQRQSPIRALSLPEGIPGV